MVVVFFSLAPLTNLFPLALSKWWCH